MTEPAERNLRIHTGDEFVSNRVPNVLSVLLVEGHPRDARRVREALLGLADPGVEVLYAASLGEAEPMATRAKLDVALLNLNLPDSEGLTTLHSLRAMRSDLPIIVLCTPDDTQTPHAAIQSGAQDYLEKGEGDTRLLSRAIRYAVERKRSEERLRFVARHDPLTGLVNRSLFREELERALARARRSARQMGVLILDLDRFKSINETLGHDTGDRLLQEVARRLRECVRESDTLARLAANEFSIIAEGLSSEVTASVIAEKVQQVMRGQFCVGEFQLMVTASIGVAVYPHGGAEVDALISNADAAMNKAKRDGGDSYRIYATSMSESARRRLAIERCLRRAMDRGEFGLHYQPKVNLADGRITGVEALLRWSSEEIGPVSPAEFIPIAEEIGLILPLGEWVMHAACLQNTQLQASGFAPMQMAVNMSARQFLRTDVVRSVTDVLHMTGMEPQFLELEITESLLMQDSKSCQRALRALREMDVRISVDDFGTGYSSLAYLTRFALNSLKVDQSFVHDIATDPADAAIVNAVIQLAHNLRLEVTAEGVETEVQLDFLKQHGCDQAQGYLFSRPLPPDELRTLLGVVDRLPVIDRGSGER